MEYLDMMNIHFICYHLDMDQITDLLNALIECLKKNIKYK